MDSKTQIVTTIAYIIGATIFGGLVSLVWASATEPSVSVVGASTGLFVALATVALAFITDKF